MTEQKKQVALVTGASRGIGAAIAAELAERGYTVIGTATTDTGAARITETLAAKGGRGVNLNVNDAAGVDALIDDLVKNEGGLHVLVNNAGITRDTLAMRMKDEDWEAVLDTNLKAVFRLSRAAIRPMMKQRFGRIISVTSVVGATGNPGQANYAAAKAGVAGMSRALARELGSRGITVNCVAPGFIATDMTAALPEEQQRLWQHRSLWDSWASLPTLHMPWPSWPRKGLVTLPDTSCMSMAACTCKLTKVMPFPRDGRLFRGGFPETARIAGSFTTPEGNHERYRSTCQKNHC